MGRAARRLAWLACAAGTLALPTAARAQRARVDLSRPVSYYIADGGDASGFREGDRALARWALEAWARQLDPAATLVPGPEATATVRVYWIDADDGLFGEMRARMVEGRFAADVFVQPDTDGLGAGIARAARSDPLFRDTVVYLTCVHELGHAFGLPHTRSFADIMYSFEHGGDFVAYFTRFRERLEARDDIPRASPFSPADRAALGSLQRGAAGR